MTKKEKKEFEKLISTIDEFTSRLIGLRQDSEESFDSQPNKKIFGDGGYYKLGYVLSGVERYSQIIRDAAKKFKDAVN